MNTNNSLNNETIINNLLDDINNHQMGGLKQLTQAERKTLKTSIEKFAQNESDSIVLDDTIKNKITHPNNYQRNSFFSFFKGIARRLFTSYLGADSLAQTIQKNAPALKEKLLKSSLSATDKAKPITDIQNKEKKIGDIPLKAKDPIITPKASSLSEKDYRTRLANSSEKEIKEYVTAEEKSHPLAEEIETETILSPLLDPQPAVNPTTTLNKTGLAGRLINLDVNYKDIQSAAKKMTADFPPVIPKIPFSEEEKKNLAKAEDTVSALESHLAQTYRSDFGDSGLGWHGRLSFQRIFWQDPKVLEALQDPLVIKLILSKASEKTEGSFGAKNTLSGLLLYGLSSNKLSYLATASPNWRTLPEGITWKEGDKWGVSQLRAQIPPKIAPETPRQITSEYIENLEKVLSSVKQALTSSNINMPKNEFSSVDEKIHNASISELITAFKTLVSDEKKIYDFCFVPNAGASTYPNNMAIQCFEGMAYYEEALALNKGNHKAVLGYGIMSHALDPRHIAAGLYMSSKTGEYYERIGIEYNGRSTVEEAQEKFEKLFQDAADGKLDPEATNLLKIRLQQLMTLVAVDPKLNITEENFLKAFASDSDKATL